MSDAAATLHALGTRLGALLNFNLLNIPGFQVTIGTLLAAFLTLLVIVLVSRLSRRALARYAQKHPDVSRATIYTLSRVLHYAILGVGILIALGVAGVSVSQFAVFAGALGVGLGFGLQAMFSNFVSGLILLFDHSLKVGDFVELASGTHGEVRDIHIRATRITTNDNIDILVPNSEFVNGRVVNWTLREVARRIKVPFRVAYGSDKEQVKRAALAAAVAVPFTLALVGARRPQVWLTGFDESAMNFALVVWLNGDAVGRQGAIVAAYNWELETSLREHGIRMPFAQRDLHVRSWPGHPEDAPAGTTPSAPSENDAARQVERALAADDALRGANRPPAARDTR